MQVKCAIAYRFEFHPYQRRFKSPLQTSHGIWDVRDGIILRLSDETGLASYGEIAPISWFGSESLEQALDFCRQLPTKITNEMIFSIPSDLPACQFGFESALEAILRGQGSGIRGQGLEEQGKQGEKFPASPRHRVSVSSSSHLAPLFEKPLARLRPSPLTYSVLLPAGEAALQAWQSLWDRGYRTFKWKIGVYPIADELEIFKLLTQALPVSAKLRLDANGGLTDEAANLWLWSCDKELSSKIEFIEQPLPVEKFTQMLELSSCYATLIALDESVATLAQLETCYQQGWREIFVIKAAIAGSPRRLRQFCQAHKIDAVFSSVFETAVGRLAALNLAAELSQNHRAVGFGVNHWFDDDAQTWLEQLWKDQ